MRGALVLSAVVALAVARPELYKEKEDFQYSRSSSDDGTKSGYYGAQRGNMGGNFERAHNMDALAQHQMGGLIKTVQGELGDGANQRSGSVYTAANSRGLYGSGHYDLSNLDGRNFQEGTSYGDSQSQSYRASHNSGHSGHTYSSANSATYGSSDRSQAQNSRYYSGYNAGDNRDQALYSNDNMQTSENLQAARQYEGHKTADSDYYSQAGYHDRSAYGHSSSTGADSSNGYGHVRLVSSAPARVYLRPGGTVTVPVAANLYEDTQSSSADQNAINTEVDSLNSNDHHHYKPTNHGKHYESSYSYRKQWEKHSDNAGSVPVALTTISPYDDNENTQAQGYVEQEASGHETQSAHSSHRYSGYNANSASSSQHSAYNSEGQSAASGSATKSSAASSNAYSHGAYNHGSSGSNYNGASANLNNQVEDISGKPKSYQSSYSYHKSWERQGDPYIIKPSTNGQYYMADGQTSQRLTSSSSNQGYNGYGSNQYYHHGHSSSGGAGCDEICGHVRVARSYNSNDQQSQTIYDGQQPQNLEYLGQQSQNLEDFGQESQNLQDFGQESQNLQDFGQQSQNLEDFGQQSQKLADLGQQSQNLEEFGQQSQKLEDLGHQSQNLEDFGQQSQKLEDLGQQSQNLEDFGQHSQKLEDMGQQSQNLEEFGQQSQKLEDLGQQSQNLEDFGQQIQDAGQQTQNNWEQSQTGLGQETQNTWNTLETLQTGNNHKNFGDQVFETSKPSYGSPVEPASHTEQENIKPNSQIGPDFDKEFNQQPAFTGQETQNSEGNSYWTQHHSSNAYSSGAVNNYNQFYVPQNLYPEHNQYYNGNWNYRLPQQYYPSTNGNYFQHSYGSGSTSHSYSNSYNPWTQTQQTVYYIPNSNNGSPYTPSSSTSSLSSLWDKLDNIEKETISHGESNTHGSHYNQESVQSSGSEFQSNHNQENLQSSVSEFQSNDNQENVQSSVSEFQSNHNQENVEGSVSELQTTNNRYNNVSEEKLINQTTISSTTAPNRIEKITTKPNYVLTDENERGDIEPEYRPQSEEDVGRGDIGPDDSTSNSGSRKPLEIVESKPTKTPQEIETLSLTKETTTVKVPNIIQNDQTNNDQSLSVISLNEQKQQEHKIVGINYGVTSSTPKTTNSIEPQIPEEVQEQNNDNQFNLSQETQNLDQQNYNQFEDFSQQNVNTDQHNVNHQIFDFGQQNQNVEDQQVNFEQHQQNVQHQIVDFGQQSVNLNEQNKEHQNMYHQTTNYDHQRENANEQNVNNNFEQQSQNIDQQNVEQIVDFGQQNVNLDQQNEEHKVVDFGKQTTNAEQEMVDFGQQNVNQEDFGQQTQQESLNEFKNDDKLDQGQEVQQLQDWGQSQQNVETMEDLNQQIQSQHFEEPSQQVEGFAPMTSHKEERVPKQPVVEPEVVTQKAANVEVPLEPTTEKPGFWKRTKDKVSSWFSRG